MRPSSGFEGCTALIWRWEQPTREDAGGIIQRTPALYLYSEIKESVLTHYFLFHEKIHERRRDPCGFDAIAFKGLDDLYGGQKVYCDNAPLAFVLSLSGAILVLSSEVADTKLAIFSNGVAFFHALFKLSPDEPTNQFMDYSEFLARHTKNLFFLS